MNTIGKENQWLTEVEVAQRLGLNPGTLRAWRSKDRRENRGTFDRPGQGALVWRRFGGAIRYWAPAIEVNWVPRVGDDRR